MKNVILSSLIILSLAACKKEEKIAPKPIAITPVVPASAVVAIKSDTIPDKAAFKIKLVKDSTNYDEAMLIFNHKSNVNYTVGEDAAYFAGFGAESLATLSNDGRDLAINSLPYTSGMSVGLDVNAKATGAYVLKMSYQNNIPSNIEIWVKDTYLRDSVNMRNTNYNFNVDKADANSFGSKRFKIIVKDNGQPQAVVNTNGPS